MSWELGPVYCGLTENVGVGAWTEPPATWSEDMGAQLELRMGFSVVKQGPGGTIEQGEFGVERNIDGAGWVEIGRTRAVDPGTIDGLATTPPEYVYEPIVMLAAWDGLDVQYRARLYWTTGTWTEAHLIHVATDLLDAGELAEFFRTEEFGQAVLILGDAPRHVRGIFNDPGVVELRIHGTRPTLLVERALVEPVVAGDPLEFDSRTFVVRGKRGATELAELILEETT